MKQKRIRLADLKAKRRVSKKQESWERLYRDRCMAILFLTAEYKNSSSFSRVYIPLLVKSWLEEMPELALDEASRVSVEDILIMSELEADRAHHLDSREQPPRRTGVC